MTALSEEITLEQAKLGETCEIIDIKEPSNADPHWRHWFEAIGLFRGEMVKIVSRGIIGADPLAVRIGQSTFALRRNEASCVCVKKIASENESFGSAQIHISLAKGGQS